MEAGLGVLDEGDKLGFRVQSSPCCTWPQPCAITLSSLCMQLYLFDHMLIQEFSSHCCLAELCYHFAVVPIALCEFD